MTTDNASNMKAACRVSESIDDDFGCFDHTLNLILKSGVDQVPYIDNCIDKFKKLASTVHRSSLNLQRIKKSCAKLNQLEQLHVTTERSSSQLTQGGTVFS